MIEAKTPFGLWLTAERKRHGWKAEDVAAKLRALGFQAEDSTYRTWEAGRRPKRSTVEALERLFDSPAPSRAPADQSDVAAAVREQTEVMRELVEELRASRSEAPTWVEPLVAALGAALTGRGIAASAELEASGAPLRSRG